ncbi:hypothetical protein RUM43_012106 [Polyplax serrata]|uniref:Uncharacterized protein n=1 Tax=Polyplax serrata TaxID=468196 RepID=A0AAN8PJD7_POLSC
MQRGQSGINGISYYVATGLSRKVSYTELIKGRREETPSLGLEDKSITEEMYLCINRCTVELNCSSLKRDVQLKKEKT